MSSGTMHEWYRFLDAHSVDEATCELVRHSARLDEILSALERASRPLHYAPGGDLDESLSMAATALGEAIEMVNDVHRRFRSGEYYVA